ncbi:MAG TPA: DNA repair protein RecN [Syntrophomonas sp.]|jgi:DNA repair protein RecN (Recombination protein N)|nr:DNA repair protein RecN [Syntrophomonas sp.]
MLQEIYISNFVLIDELRIEFSEGLNVLSGETGAGKSIIIDALGLIMGERVRNDWIRDTSRKAIAEAVFLLSPGSEGLLFLIENGLLEEGEDRLIVSREISPSGRSSARINGRNVTAGALKELATLLLDMHLQHEHLSILKPEKYLDYLDSFAEGSAELLLEVGKIYKQLREQQEELKTLERSHKDKQQQMEFITHQINEIESAALQEGEEEELNILKTRIKNAVSLLEGTNLIQSFLYSGEAGRNAHDLVAKSLDTVNNLKSEEFFAGLSDELKEIYYTLQDMAQRLDSFRQGLDFQPQQLEELEDRLYLISRLKMKYGKSIREILIYLEEARVKLSKLNRQQESKEELQAVIQALQEDYLSRTTELSAIRSKAAQLLQDRVNSELLELNMPQVKFEVCLKAREIPSRNGMDQVDFLFSPNPGEPPRPLSRIASGGELSRFVLALKTVLARVYRVPTLIFDEIDVGVGGSALTAMARKLSQLAISYQVILVTHSAQVASFAQTHYLIEKQVENNHTYTRVRELDDVKRVTEIARMLAGDNFSPLTLEHAREMLRSNGKQ